MQSPIKKIEDLIDKVSATISFDHQASDKQQLEDSTSTLSFPRILDFAFPDDKDEHVSSLQIGEITYVGDGVIHVTGLGKATIDEVVEVKTTAGTEKALILGVQEEKVEAVVLGDYTNIRRGDQVKSTASRLTIPVGKSMLGRVINPLGHPLDNKGAVKGTERRMVEFAAPGVMDRQPILDPLNTGTMVIDATIPIGRGQRELVIGDRKTGKSRTMLDIICNQKNENVFCIYVGVGIQAAKAQATIRMLEERGAMKYTTIVIARADEPPSLQYIAPYVGSALAEYFLYKGQHALIVYDDLSKQAKAYRQVSLLLKRSPGRDAYPGDIFFLHSRLLERASKVSDDLGGGSITALPIAETQGGDVSDYIITNLMSITDGHIFLDANLMHEGILPAVNSGTSVSRIGGVVQTKLLRKVGELAGRILARYNEVKSFETINTEVSEDTIRDIKRGKRLKEILAQDCALTLTNDEQIILLGVATSNRMDHLELQHTVTFKEKIIPYYREGGFTALKTKIAESKNLEDIDPLIDEIFSKFCQKFGLPILDKKPIT